MRFFLSHTYYLSHMRRTWLWVLDWDDTDTCWNANRWRDAHDTVWVSGCVHVAYDCERLPALDESYRESNASCVPVALSLKRIVRRMSLITLYYSKTYMGKLWPWAYVYSTSQISVIFYGIMTLNTASLVVIAALWGSKAAICWL